LVASARIVNILATAILPQTRSTLFPYTTLFRSRDAGVFGDRHHDQRDQRQRQRNAQADLTRSHVGRDGGKLGRAGDQREREHGQDRKSTRLNSSHVKISYAVFCLKKKI